MPRVKRKSMRMRELAAENGSEGVPDCDAKGRMETDGNFGCGEKELMSKMEATCHPAAPAREGVPLAGAAGWQVGVRPLVLRIAD